MRDYKDFKASRKINKDRVAVCLLSIALIIVLSVRLAPVSAEPKLAVVTYDCSPAFELDMPIALDQVTL